MRFATIALVFACAAPAFGQSNPPDSTRIVAVEDAFAVFSDSSLTVAGSGLLSNDEIVGVDSVVAVLVDPPAHGAVLLAPSGAFTYTPATGFSGDDTFSYHIQTVPR
ncbi:MAG: Ig-like domain-containing protein, partial [Rhodothermales bacterium]